MTLIQKQTQFARLIPRLIDKAFTLGFTVTLGECYRSPEEAARLFKAGKGIINSLHTSRLAIDLNLFRDGNYLTDDASHRELGLWWEQQSIDGEYTCAWGGHFGDGNHYSIMHENRK